MNGLCRSPTCPMRTQLKKASRRGLLENTGKNGRYESETVWISLQDKATQTKKDREDFLSCSYEYFFVKVNGLIRKAVIPPPTTHPGEVSQVTLWQGCEPVKVKMTRIEFSHKITSSSPTVTLAHYWSHTHILTSCFIDVMRNYYLWYIKATEHSLRFWLGFWDIFHGMFPVF